MDNLAEHVCVGGPLDGEVIGEIHEDPVSMKVVFNLYVCTYTMGLAASGPLRAQYFSHCVSDGGYPHHCGAQYRLGQDSHLYYDKMVDCTQ